MGFNKIDVLFIQPEKLEIKCLKFKGNEIPLGLLYLASSIEREGFTSDVLDFNIVSDDLSIVLKKTRPKLVAITATTPKILKAHEIAKTTKTFDENIITLIGGPHISALPFLTLKEFPSFDYGICGEGELAMVDLLRALKRNKNITKIKGLIYRKENKIKKNELQEEIKKIDEIPFPARYKLDQKKYMPLPGNYEKLPSTDMITSRGCPYNCRFCSEVPFSKKIRFRSSDNVIKEIEHCIECYNIFNFNFIDDLFTLNKLRVKKFCNQIIKKKLNISWNCFSRVDTINYELLKLMKKAGCYHIKYGIESGSQRILNLMNKGITLKQVERAVSATKKVNMRCKASFILGIPGENKSDLLKTLDFVKKLSLDITTFCVFKPFPGSKFYSVLKKQKTIKDVPWTYYSTYGDSMINSSLDDKELKEIFKKAYRETYISPQYFKQTIKRLLKNPKIEIELIYRGLKTLGPIFK